MDFIRKNWGLLLYSLGCLVLAGVVGFKVIQARRFAAAKQKALTDQLQWFDGVKKDNIRLSKENERAAQDNRDRAERTFTDVRQTMASKYRVDPKNPATPVEAVRALVAELGAMNRMLDTAEPPVEYANCAYLSFEKRSQSKDLPPMEDVPKIFRQLRIVGEIVRIVRESHLVSLNAIERPLDLTVIEEDLYTATPVILNVTGTADQVQNFINAMVTPVNYLFFLRNISISTPDQAPGGALGGASSTGGTGMPMGPGMEGGMSPSGGMGPGGSGPGGAMRTGSGPGAAMGPMMEGGPSGGASRPAKAPRGRRGASTTPGAGTASGMPGMSPAGMPGMSPAGMPGMGPGAMMPGMATGQPGTSGVAAAEPMLREDLRVFMQDNLVTAELRFDLIEFNQPEASPQQP